MGARPGGRARPSEERRPGVRGPDIYRQAQDACTSSNAAPCTGGSYGRDFFDVTQSEYGAGNGAYQPGPGWDYASGWGALNVANFIQDVDGSPPQSTAGGTEKPRGTVNATSTSPTGTRPTPSM